MKTVFFIFATLLFLQSGSACAQHNFHQETTPDPYRMKLCTTALGQLSEQTSVVIDENQHYLFCLQFVKKIQSKEKAEVNESDSIDFTEKEQIIWNRMEDYKNFLYACQRGNLLTVKKLLKKGHAKIELTNSYEQTPLMLAAWYDRFAVVKYLLKQGADIHAVGEHGQTVLMWGVQSNNKEVVRAFLDLGADINAQDESGWTPLIWAIKNENPSVEMVSFLVARGADIYIKDHYGVSPYAWAMKEYLEEIADILVKNGATGQ
ncbi:MAG: ankyrin repeat domain-containing protein [Bdellovibrionales bacterium]|nr:ankyrin repeat domain-containing protein [Bdellovibrionales bacterium]